MQVNFARATTQNPCMCRISLTEPQNVKILVFAIVKSTVLIIHKIHAFAKVKVIKSMQITLVQTNSIGFCSVWKFFRQNKTFFPFNREVPVKSRV